MNTLKVQQALEALGYAPGPLDGIRGRLTIRAVKQFQRDNGLPADGIVGSVTSAVLFDKPTNPMPSPVWHQTAKELLGLQEKAGPESNETILSWAVGLEIDYENDEIPWCGLFVGHCVGSSLPEEPLPTNVLWSRAWLKFGVPVTPRIGAILVFWRGQRAGWKGHVGFYAGETEDHFLVLGGNQSNSVSVVRIDKDRLLDCRWPTTGDPKEHFPPLLTDSDADVSTNEA